jgi:hypothetical protein
MVLLFWALSLGLPRLTHSAAFTLGAGSGMEADATYINEAAPSGNYGSSTRLWLGGSSSGIDAYVLLNWLALKDSLVNRTVDACSLFVKPQAEVANVDGLFACFRIRSARDWVESQTTWTDFKTSNPWSTSGARNTVSDIFSPPVDAKVESQFANGVYTAFDITSIARQWDGLDTANCRGVVLKQYGGTDPSQIDLASDDNAVTGNRPKIKVVYHEGIDSPLTGRRRNIISAELEHKSPTSTLPSHKGHK